MHDEVEDVTDGPLKSIILKEKRHKNNSDF